MERTEYHVERPEIKVEEVKAKILKLLRKMGGDSFENWMVGCDDQIGKTYSREEKKRYMLWHALVLGTVADSEELGVHMDRLDFPGDLSVEKMVNDKYNEYEKK